MSIGTHPGLPRRAAQDPRSSCNPPGLAQISYRVDDFTGFRRALLRPLPRRAGHRHLAAGAGRSRPAGTGMVGLPRGRAHLLQRAHRERELPQDRHAARERREPGGAARLPAGSGHRGQRVPGRRALGGAPGRAAGHPGGPAPVQRGDSGYPVADLRGRRGGQLQRPVERACQSPAGHRPGRQADGTPQCVLLAGRVGGIRAGDRLILVDSLFTGRDDGWSPVTVAALTPTTDPGTGVVNTLVTFAAGRPLPSAPATRYRLLRAAATTALWNQGATGPGQVVVEQTGSALTVHLSAAVRGISPGDLVLFDLGAGAPSALCVVAGIGEALWTVPYPVRVRRVSSQPAGHRRSAHGPHAPDRGLGHAAAGRPDHGRRSVRLQGRGHDHRGPAGHPRELPGDRRGTCGLCTAAPAPRPSSRTRRAPASWSRSAARETARSRSPRRPPPPRRPARNWWHRSSCSWTWCRCHAGRP